MQPLPGTGSRLRTLRPLLVGGRNDLQRQRENDYALAKPSVDDRSSAQAIIFTMCNSYRIAQPKARPHLTIKRRHPAPERITPQA